MNDTVVLFLTSDCLDVSELNALIKEHGGWSEPVKVTEERRQRNLSTEILAEGGGSIVTGIIALRVLAHVISELLRRRRFHVSIAVDETQVSVEWSGDSKTASTVSTELERVIKAARIPSGERLPLARLEIEEIKNDPTEVKD